MSTAVLDRGAATDSALRLAFDRDSVRALDRDGRMRVAKANISKANVCPYRGREIPDFEKLGLEPDRIYQMLRHPDELKKAVPTFNGVQILRKHIPVSADDHQPYDVVGSTGTDASFDGKYLTNSLNIWARDAIDGIESDDKKELSSGYHYTPDMTPGEFDGNAYDGVMRDIVGNHVALVEDGRAGPDVVVGDSTENLNMKPTRLAALTLNLTAAHVAPLLAMDAKIELPKALFADINTKNFKTKKTALLAGVRAAIDGKLRKGLALDEGTTGLARLLDALEGTAEGSDESVSEEQHKAMEAAAGGKSELGIPKAVGEEFSKADKGKGFDAAAEFLRGKGMSEDDISAVSSMFPQPAADEDPDEAAKKAKEDEEAKAKAKAEDEDKMKDMVTKPAMDAALKENAKAVRETERGIRIALAEVKPYIGELDPTMAFDSAADVYRHTLKTLSVDGADTMHADALLPVLKSRPTIAQMNTTTREHIAMDSGVTPAIKDRFPGIDRFN